LGAYCLGLGPLEGSGLPTGPADLNVSLWKVSRHGAADLNVLRNWLGGLFFAFYDGFVFGYIYSKVLIAGARSLWKVSGHGPADLNELAS
ncbi:hypothetical protein Tco_0192627, partial [Tanacetum coccineum]